MPIPGSLKDKGVGQIGLWGTDRGPGVTPVSKHPFQRTENHGELGSICVLWVQNRRGSLSLRELVLLIRQTWFHVALCDRSSVLILAVEFQLVVS